MNYIQENHKYNKKICMWYINILPIIQHKHVSNWFIYSLMYLNLSGGLLIWANSGNNIDFVYDLQLDGGWDFPALIIIVNLYPLFVPIFCVWENFDGYLGSFVALDWRFSFSGTIHKLHNASGGRGSRIFVTMTC